MTETATPVMIDTFSFSTRPDGVTDIMQHYAKETEMGAIATPIAQIKGDTVSFCGQPPEALIRFGRAAGRMVSEDSWPKECVGCGLASVHTDGDGEEQCTDCLRDTIKDNEADTGE